MLGDETKCLEWKNVMFFKLSLFTELYKYFDWSLAVAVGSLALSMIEKYSERGMCLLKARLHSTSKDASKQRQTRVNFRYPVYMFKAG